MLYSEPLKKPRGIPVSRIAKLELHKDEFNFSAGHFTIFSATSREDLHGHNYNVSLKLEVLIGDNGLAFDYRVYKQKILHLIQQLDRKFLLAAHSKFLTIEETPDFILAHFNNEKIPFLKRDVVILSVTNVTIEELAHWFLKQLSIESNLKKDGILKMELSVYNGPGQSGTSIYQVEHSVEKLSIA